MVVPSYKESKNNVVFNVSVLVPKSGLLAAKRPSLSPDLVKKQQISALLDHAYQYLGQRRGVI